MHSNLERQDKQSDNSRSLSVQGETSQSCPLQQRSKGHRAAPFPNVICLKEPYGQVKQSETLMHYTYFKTWRAPNLSFWKHTCSFLELRKDFFFFPLLQYLIKEKSWRAEEQNADSFTGPMSSFHKGMWGSLVKFVHWKKRGEKSKQALVVFKSRAAFFQCV